MCGRYSNRLTWREIHDLYSILNPKDGEWEGRVNIPPSVRVPIIRTDGLAMARWGLVPGWAKEIGKFATHNAMLETVAGKPTYRTAWKKGQRCLISAQSFFERRKSDKQDFAIGLANGGPMAFAGLWDLATIEGNPVLSATMLTTVPNELMAPIHHRMPIIIGEEDYDTWLRGGQLMPVGPERMRAWKIGPAWGKVGTEDPVILDPV